MVADQDAAGLEQLVEGLQQLPLRGLGLAALGLDALAHVAIEEVDRLPGRPVDRGSVVLAELHQRAQGHAGGDELHAGRDGVEVVGRVYGFLTTGHGDQQSRLLESRQQRLRDPASLGELGQRQGLRGGGVGDRGDQGLVGRLELPGQEALDHGQGEALLLQLLDPTQPLEVRVAVPGDPTLPPR